MKIIKINKEKIEILYDGKTVAQFDAEPHYYDY